MSKYQAWGYTSKSVFEVEVTNSKPAIINIELESSVENLKEVTVKTNSFQRKEESPVSVRSIGVNEIQRYPGATGTSRASFSRFPVWASVQAFAMTSSYGVARRQRINFTSTI
jgi:hypothetical protein